MSGPNLAATVTAIAYIDAGAQIYARGPDIADEIGLRTEELVPTSHSINGITQSSVHVSAAFCAKISSNSRTTCQQVYVTYNISGFFPPAL